MGKTFGCFASEFFNFDLYFLGVFAVSLSPPLPLEPETIYCRFVFLKPDLINRNINACEIFPSSVISSLLNRMEAQTAEAMKLQQRLRRITTKNACKIFICLKAIEMGKMNYFRRLIYVISPHRTE